MGMKNILIKLLKRVRIDQFLRLVFYLTSKLFKPKNIIVFESFLGKQYSDNPKAIYKYTKKNYPEYKMYWSIDRNFNKSKNKNLNYIVRLTPKWIYIMATSKYWIVNSRLPLWIPKPKHTTYVQTWHGTPLKKLGKDIKKVHMVGANTHTYKLEFLKEASKWDYLISPNEYSTKIFRGAFNFRKKIIESGYPRNDILFHCNNNKYINKIKQSLKIPLNKKVILYAPTWRDNEYYSTGKYKHSLKLNLKKLKKELKDEYIILLRMHYLVAENINLQPYKDFAYDLSSYNDINELFLISDLLITDYSSVFFDYANLKRPMIFFVYDMEEYKDDIRGFYFNFEEYAPGPLLTTTNEVIKEIKNISIDDFVPSESFERFYEKFCYLEDGNASERVAKAIIGK